MALPFRTSLISIGEDQCFREDGSPGESHMLGLGDFWRGRWDSASKAGQGSNPPSGVCFVTLTKI